MSELNTFDKRAAAIKSTLVATEGVLPKTPAEGQLSASNIKDNLVLDLKMAVKQVDALRAGSKDLPAIDISWGQFIKEKWGFSPSEDGKLDSFYAALGINPSYNTLEHFNTFPEFNENYRWVIPEVIREAVRLGLRKNPIYSKLIAAEETVTQPSVIMPSINMSDAMPKAIGDVETIPTGTISYGQKTVDLTKLGTGIKISDQVNQYVSLNVLSIYLQDVGIKLGLGLDTLAINTLLNGDQADGSLSAATIGVENTSNGITYYDLLRAWLRMGRLGRMPNRIVSNENPALDILNLAEFKGNLGGGTVNTTILLDTPVPTVQNYSIHGAMPASNKIMLIDTASALIKLNSTALRVEGDRIVEKGLNATYVSLTTGFANLFRDARLLIDKSVTIGASPFPSWMDAGAAEAVSFK